MIEPRYTVAIRFPVFADSEKEAMQKALPYARDMRVPCDALEVIDRESGEVCAVYPL